MTPSEQCVYDELTSQGFQVLTKGWPDFFVLYGDAQGVGIEVKSAGSKPEPHQLVMHEALRRAGLEVVVCEQGAETERSVLGWLSFVASWKEHVARNTSMLRNVAPASTYASASALLRLPGVNGVEGEDGEDVLL